MRTRFLLIAALLWAVPSFAQAPTWIASASGLATTAAYTMSVEASSLRSVTISQICIGTSSATSAAAVTVTVQRRITASSGGTQATNESTSTPAVSALEPGDGPFPGVVRVTPTLGTAGAILDQWGFSVGEIGSTDDPPSQPIFCKNYGTNGDKRLVIPQGTGNAISISVGAAGSGGLASGAISATLQVQP